MVLWCCTLVLAEIKTRPGGLFMTLSHVNRTVFWTNYLQNAYCIYKSGGIKLGVGSVVERCRERGREVTAGFGQW